MWVKKLDMLSPPITLFYNEESQHSSICSGILSIVVFIAVILAVIYYLLNFIERKSPKAYFYNKYTEDIGTFPVNATSMFNFIQLIDRKSNAIMRFDFDSFIAIGFDNAYNGDPSIIKDIDHWIYGYCNNDSDTEGISELIDFKYYEQSACIRKYYDSKTHKYINTGEKKFRWPVIEKNNDHPDRTYYGIIIQRYDYFPELLKKELHQTYKRALSDDSEENIENTDITEITEYTDYADNTENKENTEITEIIEYTDNKENTEITIEEVSFNFQIMNHYADMLNYDKPFTKYFKTIKSDVIDGAYKTIHLNFNPANLSTYNGFFFENIVEETSYIYDSSKEYKIKERNNKKNGCLISIYFWMNNSLQCYERIYDRFQDTLSDIGGITFIIIALAYGINLLINHFVILLDMEKFVTDYDQFNYNRIDINQVNYNRRYTNQVNYNRRDISQVNYNRRDFNQVNNNRRDISQANFNRRDIGQVNYNRRDRRDIQERSSIFRRVNQIMYPPRKSYTVKKKESSICDEPMSSNYQRLLNEGVNLFQLPKINEQNIKPYMNRNVKRNNIYNINIRNNGIYSSNNQQKNNYIERENQKLQNYSRKKYTNICSNGRKDITYSSYKIEDSYDDYENKSTFCKYISYLIYCRRNNPKFSYIESLRAKLISEENILQIYVDLLRILKIHGINKTSLFNQDNN